MIFNRSRDETKDLICKKAKKIYETNRFWRSEDRTLSPKAYSETQATRKPKLFIKAHYVGRFCFMLVNNKLTQKITVHRASPSVATSKKNSTPHFMKRFQFQFVALPVSVSNKIVIFVVIYPKQLIITLCSTFFLQQTSEKPWELSNTFLALKELFMLFCNSL